MGNNYNRVTQFYNELSRHSELGSPESLGWENRDYQFERFRLLSEIGVKNGDSVLDLGCGYGDIIDYFKENSISIDYTGIDIRRDAIITAKQKHPDNIFKQSDIIFERETYDWVLASGVFPIKSLDWKEETKETLGQAYKICKKGVAANFLSDANKQNKRYKDMHYVLPSDLLSDIIEPNFRLFSLRHGYKLNEFTVYLFHI